MDDFMMMPPPDEDSGFMMMGPPDSTPASNTNSDFEMMPPPDVALPGYNVEVESEWVELSKGGMTFYYNIKSKISLWEKPREYKPSTRPRAVLAEKLGTSDWRKIYLNTYRSYYYNVKSREVQWHIPDEVKDIVRELKEKRAQEKLKQKEDIESVTKRKHEDDSDSDEDNNKKAKIEESSDEEEDDEEEEEEEEPEKPTGPVMTIEEKIDTFRQMLREKNIPPFTTWEKELPKFAFDPRFKLIPDVADRRAIFEDYVKHRLEEQRKEHKERHSTVKEQCAKIIENDPNKFTLNTSFETFKDEFREQLKSLTSKEKERLYTELLEPLKQKNNEQETTDKNKAEDDFKKLLSETKDVTIHATWLKIKRVIEKDPRFKNKTLDLEDKEKLFDEFIVNMKKEEEIKRKKREEASLKEREAQVAKIKQQEREDRNRALNKFTQEERETEYKTLLREKIKDPEASWTRNRRLLETDPRFSDRLSLDTKERLFREHCKMLQQDIESAFKQMLREAAEKETIGVTAKDLNSVKDLFRDDPRYERVRREDREYLFREFMRDLKKEAWDDFRILLKESKIDGYVSRLTPTSGAKFDQFKELIKIDKRYVRLNDLGSERDKAIVEYIEKLRKDYEASGNKA